MDNIKERRDHRMSVEAGNVQNDYTRRKAELASVEQELAVQKQVLQHTVEQVMQFRLVQEEMKAKKVAKGRGETSPESCLIAKQFGEDPSQIADALLDISELRARKTELQKYCQSYHRQVHQLRQEKTDLQTELVELNGHIAQLRRYLASSEARVNASLATENCQGQNSIHSCRGNGASTLMETTNHTDGDLDQYSSGSQEKHHPNVLEEDEEQDSDISVSSDSSKNSNVNEDIMEAEQFSDEHSSAASEGVQIPDHTRGAAPAERAWLQAQVRAAVPLKKSLKERVLGKLYDSAQEEPKEYHEAWARVQPHSWASVTGNVSPFCLSQSQASAVAVQKYQQKMESNGGAEYPDNSNVSSYVGCADVHTVSHRVEQHISKSWEKWLHDNVKQKRKEIPSSLASRHGWKS